LLLDKHVQYDDDHDDSNEKRESDGGHYMRKQKAHYLSSGTALSITKPALNNREIKPGPDW
jgi:hypothetical protein